MEDRRNRTHAAQANTFRILSGILALATVLAISSYANADGPDWIWTPKTSVGKTRKPAKECFFRKKLTLVGPQKAELVFSAGDEYEIYLNDQLVKRGQSFGKVETLDVTKFIEPGVNLIAARVRHFQSDYPGLSMKFRVKEKGEMRWRSLKTDSSWKTRIVENESWTKSRYNDMGWIAAQQTSAEVVAEAKRKKQAAEFAKQGSHEEALQAAASKAAAVKVAKAKSTANAELASKLQQQLPEMGLNVSDAPPVAANQQSLTMIKSKPMAAVATNSVSNQTNRNTSKPTNQLTFVSKQTNAAPVESGRFQLPSQFKVERIMAGAETGSLIAMEFDEFGRLLLSRDGGPLMIADPSQPVGSPNRLRVYCEEVTSCHGILPLNGRVYVTGLGKSGSGLYELADTDNDGKLTVARKLLGFAGKANVRGPHGVQLGPDGMIYVVIGNGGQVQQPLAETSPLKSFYQGDLVPQLENSAGQKNGVLNRGGTVVRVSLDGKKVERVAGGIHNAYDLVVDGTGEIFIHDIGVGSDRSATWYRPATFYHVPAGAELGWRSGWAKSPEYYIDQIPSMAEIDGGTPMGTAQYSHLQFPQQYRDSLFMADWSEGRILVLKPQPNGAGFVAKPETFIKGRPLNVCDLAVGEDGGLYFCTGGRGTEGGVYRVSWSGEVPAELMNFENMLEKAIRHPQPQSAWARQNIAQIRMKMGEAWGQGIEAVAKQTRNLTSERVRALQLMAMFGPAPSDELLKTLAADGKPEIRAQAARMCVRGSLE